MKINKIISGVFSLLILSSFIGCTEIEDHPDGRTDYSDLFTTNRKTYTYMNQMCIRDSFDPEQNSPAAYPTMRTYNVGLNITF